MIISLFANAASMPDRYKAPKGMMFKVDSIYWHTLSAADNSIYILPYLLEDEITSKTQDDPLDALYVINMGSVTSGQITFKTGEITKFISLVERSSTNFGCFIFIEYQLVKATKKDLIIEWLRRGR